MSSTVIERPTRAAPPAAVEPPAGAVLLGAPIELKANADGGLPARFSGTAYSGGYVPDYEVVIDMATTTYKSRMPLLDSHMRWEIIGVIEQASTQDHQMQVAGRLFSDMPGSAAERIGQLAQRGVPYEMSVGLYAFTREFVPAGKSVNVNGQTFNGPVNVLRNGQVREVSIVTLGADPRTASKFFEQQPPEGAQPMTTHTVEQLSAQVAELTAQAQRHTAELAAAREEGAAAERARIQAVQAQALPGHEQLIAGLMFDGKTGGAEAAVAVLAAERTQRTAAALALAADAPKPVAPAATPAVTPPAEAAPAEASLSLEDRCKAQWDSTPALRAEFGSVAAFVAYSRAQERGAARILKTTPEA